MASCALPSMDTVTRGEDYGVDLLVGFVVEQLLAAGVAAEEVKVGNSDTATPNCELHSVMHRMHASRTASRAGFDIHHKTTPLVSRRCRHNTSQLRPRQSTFPWCRRRCRERSCHR